MDAQTLQMHVAYHYAISVNQYVDFAGQLSALRDMWKLLFEDLEWIDRAYPAKVLPSSVTDLTGEAFSAKLRAAIPDIFSRMSDAGIAPKRLAITLDELHDTRARGRRHLTTATRAAASVGAFYGQLDTLYTICVRPVAHSGGSSEAAQQQINKQRGLETQRLFRMIAGRLAGASGTALLTVLATDPQQMVVNLEHLGPVLADLVQRLEGLMPELSRLTLEVLQVRQLGIKGPGGISM